MRLRVLPAIHDDGVGGARAGLVAGLLQRLAEQDVRAHPEDRLRKERAELVREDVARARRATQERERSVRAPGAEVHLTEQDLEPPPMLRRESALGHRGE